MARIRETLPDLQQMIIERLHGTRLKIKSGDTADALNWTELSYPFRVGNKHVRNPSDIRHISANEYFKDKFVRIRKKGLHEPKVGSDGHYDMLVDIYDIHEGKPGSGNFPVATKVHVDSSMCFFKADGKSKSKGKTRRKTTKKKRAKRSTKRTHKQRTHKRQRGGSGGEEPGAEPEAEPGAEPGDEPEAERRGISPNVTTHLDYHTALRIMAAMIHTAITNLQSAIGSFPQMQAFVHSTQVMSDVSQMVDIRVNSIPEIIDELLQQLKDIMHGMSGFTLADLKLLPGTQLMFPSLCTTCYCPDIGAQIHAPLMAPKNAPEEVIYMLHLLAYMKDVSNEALPIEDKNVRAANRTQGLLGMIYDPKNEDSFTVADFMELVTNYIAYTNTKSNASLIQAEEDLYNIPQWLGDISFSGTGMELLQKLLTTFICHPLTFDITEPCQKSLDVRIKLIESFCNYTHLTLSDQSNLQSTQRLYTMIDLVISPLIVLMNGGRGQLSEFSPDAGETAAGSQTDQAATDIAYKNLALATCLLTDDTLTETLPSEIIRNIARHHTNTHPAISHAMNVVACIKILMGNISRNLQHRNKAVGITGRRESDAEVAAATAIQSIRRGETARARLRELVGTVNTTLHGQENVTHKDFIDAIKSELLKVDFSNLH